jgi:5-methylthioribose kinase
MEWIDAENAAEYLTARRLIVPGEPVDVRRLGGGVSNVVLYVTRSMPECCDFVVKQAREKLRVQADWRCPVERIWREADVLRATSVLLSDGSHGDLPHTHETPQLARTPEILFEDRENYVITMTAAPADHEVWKAMLLEGRCDARIAAACGRLLGTLHAGSWMDGRLSVQLGDWRFFDRLRIDPYYRKVASIHADIAPLVYRLIDDMDRHRLALVHADFSPKNLLVFSGGLMMVDFETGHFGDPAFDLGFFLSHLVLKAFFHAPRHAPFLELSQKFLDSYRDRILSSLSADDHAALESRGNLHFAACGLSRLDGKSPVDYLQDISRQDRLRSLCKWVLQQQPQNWSEIVRRCREELSATT